jgi:hypothetical protein
VLENPIELVIEFRRQVEEISEKIFLICDSRPRIRFRDRARCKINSQHVIRWRADRTHIMAGAATRNANFSGERSILRQEINQRGMRYSFLPRCLAPAIGFIPISLRLPHGCGSLALSGMSFAFSNRAR